MTDLPKVDHPMTHPQLVKSKVEFPEEICIQSTEADLLSENTIEASANLLCAAKDQGHDFRVVERRFEVDHDGFSDQGPFMKIFGPVGDRIEEIDPHQPLDGLRTVELVAGAMAITDAKLTSFIVKELESHACAHDITNQTYRVVIFPYAVMLCPVRPFWLLESALSHHGKLFKSDVDRAIRVICQKGSSAHARLHTSSVIDRFLHGLAGSPEAAQVRAGLPRGINESLARIQFTISIKA